MAHDVFQNAGRRPPAPNINHNTTTDNTDLHKDKDPINKEPNLNATYSYPPQLFYASFSTNSAVAATHQNLKQNKTVTKVTTLKPNSTRHLTPTVVYDIAPTHPEIQNSTIHQQFYPLDRQKHSTTQPASTAGTTPTPHAVYRQAPSHLYNTTTGSTKQPFTSATPVPTTTSNNDHKTNTDRTMHHHLHDDIKPRSSTNPPLATHNASHPSTTHGFPPNYTTFHVPNDDNDDNTHWRTARNDATEFIQTSSNPSNTREPYSAMNTTQPYHTAPRSNPASYNQQNIYTSPNSIKSLSQSLPPTSVSSKNTTHSPVHSRSPVRH
jgi:hypothetical protein